MTEGHSVFQRLVELSTDFMCVLTPEGRLAYAGPSFEKLGYPCPEMVGRSFTDLAHAEDRPTLREALDSDEESENPRHVAVRFRCADGRYLPVTWTILSELDGRRLAIGRDASAHHSLRDCPEDQALFLDAIVENIPNMIFVKEAGRLSFVRFNRAGEDLLGISREDLLGKTDFDLFPKEEAAFFQKKDRETLKGKLLVDIPEEPIATPLGERWLHTKKVPILDELGEPKYMLGISEDITELRKARTELLHSRERAQALNRELEAFSYSVAHDLRAPLRSIDGFSEALLEDYHDKLDEEGRRYLGYVRGSAQEMARLIDDILALSRVTRSEMSRSPTNLSVLATSSVAKLRAVEPERCVDVKIASDLIEQADERLVGVVIENLIGNAWKFTRGRTKGSIEVGAMPETSVPTFFVRDNGAGFDMAYSSKLFGVFQRLHSTSEFEGTGIGLATVQRIVRRHQGRVWAEGKVGEGATFFFTLRKGISEP